MVCWGCIVEPPVLPGYKVLKRLGQGACGYVWLAEDRSHPQPQYRVAIKCLPAPGGSPAPPLWAVEAAEREALALSAVGWGHINLIRPLEVLLTDKVLALVCRFCSGGTLEHFCKRRHISEDLACYFLHQLVAVVEYLHTHRVAYRDLKLENVLLDRPVSLFGRGPPPRLVLADFGTAKCFKKGEAPMTATFLGTPGFMSPQVLAAMGNPSRTTSGRPATPGDAKPDGNAAAADPVTADGGHAPRYTAAAAGYDAAGDGVDDEDDSSGSATASFVTGRLFDAFKADSWALGALLHYMLFGELPYGYSTFAPLMPPQEALLTLLQLEHSHSWREAGLHAQGGQRKISPEAQDLLDKLLHPDEDDRLDITAIRQHPWMQRQLPKRYEEALRDMRYQQAALDAAARGTNTRECRRLLQQAVSKLFSLSRSPAVLHGLQQERQQAKQQEQTPQDCQQHPGSVSVPLLCLKRNLAAAAAAAAAQSSPGGEGVGLAHAGSSGLTLKPSWSLEAALAIEVVAQDTVPADGELSAAAVVPAPVAAIAAAVAAAVQAVEDSDSSSRRPGCDSGGAGRRGHLGRSSNVVRQQVLHTLTRLDQVASAAARKAVAGTKTAAVAATAAAK